MALMLWLFTLLPWLFPEALPHCSVLYGLEHSALPRAPSSLPFHTPNSSPLLSGLYGFAFMAQCPVHTPRLCPSSQDLAPLVWPSLPCPHGPSLSPLLPSLLYPQPHLLSLAFMAVLLWPSPLPILPAHSLAHKALSYFLGLHGIAFLSLTFVPIPVLALPPVLASVFNGFYLMTLPHATSSISFMCVHGLAPISLLLMTLPLWPCHMLPPSCPCPLLQDIFPCSGLHGLALWS